MINLSIDDITLTEMFLFVEFNNNIYHHNLLECAKIMYTVFDLITAPALITPPPLTFYLIFTYYRPLDDLFLDFLLYLCLLSPTWRS